MIYDNDGRVVSEIVADVVRQLQSEAHTTAMSKGWWDVPRSGAECVALMHSELSEALEAMRHGNPPDEQCVGYGNVEVELADCIIRILDYCDSECLDLAGALLAKMKFNEGREYKHGKEF